MNPVESEAQEIALDESFFLNQWILERLHMQISMPLFIVKISASLVFNANVFREG